MMTAMNAPATRRWRTAQWAVGTIAAAAIVTGAFLLGRATAPEPEDDTAAVCEDAQEAAREATADVEDWTAEHEQPLTSAEQTEGKRYASKALNVIVQNPDCFDASDRAEAQAFLDQLGR